MLLNLKHKTWKIIYALKVEDVNIRELNSIQSLKLNILYSRFAIIVAKSPWDTHKDFRKYILLSEYKPLRRKRTPFPSSTMLFCSWDT